MENLQSKEQIKYERIPTISHALREIRDASGESISQLKNKVADTTRETVLKVDHSVHKNPWYFIGGAAGLAVIIGYLLGHKSKPE